MQDEDIIGISPKPEENVKMIMSFQDIIECVRGNHDNYLINGIPELFKYFRFIFY